jgi:hypothetical protein
VGAAQAWQEILATAKPGPELGAGGTDASALIGRQSRACSATGGSFLAGAASKDEIVLPRATAASARSKWPN